MIEPKQDLKPICVIHLDKIMMELIQKILCKPNNGVPLDLEVPK